MRGILRKARLGMHFPEMPKIFGAFINDVDVVSGDTLLGSISHGFSGVSLMRP